ncbi:HAD-IA family hydrolase [Streptomyces sp. NBC_00487]|uniref:HAD-IA family hydrolase n=1 Tax=unclassified Streptomyces TaxID=2593676 RepID=UPI002E18CD3D|nr:MULTISPECIES: HAD-IA family hydrolase [unclassified Streptomyces]
MPQLAYDAVLCDIDAERLGTQADRCLFVDDTADNVVAARAAGMTALHYRRLDDLRRALSPRLNTPGSQADRS